MIKIIIIIMGDQSKGTAWMYNPVSEINREEYLLGKKIGKDFDAEGTMGKINDVEYDCTPASIFASQAGHQVDIQRKLLEDPLVSIKKREAEDRQRVLDNPIKMKALNEHIASMNKSKKKKKKKKKDDSDSDEDLDLKLLKKIQRMEQGGGDDSIGDSDEDDKKKKKKKKHKARESNRRSRSRSVERRRHRSPSEEKHRKRSPDRRRWRSPSNSPPRRRRSPSKSPPRRKRRSPSNSPPRRRRSPSNSHRRRRRSPSNSPPRRRRSPSDSPPRRRRDSGSTSPPKKKAGLDLMGKSSSNGHRNDKRRDSPPSKPSSQAQIHGRKAGLTDEEKQAKLAEMMANAEWRDEQRTARVMKHRSEQAKEEEEHTGGDHDKEFMTRELQRAQSSLTVESRLTANKYKLQRGYGDMDKNFARR